MSGTDAEGFGSWPGNVPERNDSGVRQPFTYHFRQQGKMIILNQDNRVWTFCLFNDGGGKPRIDGTIVIPIRFSEGRPHKRDMT